MAENGASVSHKARNARACEACRASKSRCFFRNQQNVCYKCEQSGNECLIRTKARPMRARASGPATDSSSRSAGSDFSIALPTVTAPDSREDCEELFQHHRYFFPDDDANDFRPSEVSRDQRTASNSLIEQRKVHRNQAEQLLSAFRSKVAFFPFVPVAPEATVPSLSRSSPFLLLAILTVASSPDSDLHHQMDHEFRRVLSSKVIVEGQKSLDYLQGMLVYIAWYPMHSKPKNNQAFMYMNLAISLVADLGLDQAHPNMSIFNAISTKGLVEDAAFTKKAKRAYLGCYYLSSALSQGFQKPNNLQYRNLMDDRGEVLLEGERDNNFSLNDVTSLVKLQRLAERIGEFHSSSSSGTNTSQEASRIAEVNIQTFLNELQDWRANTSDEVRNLPYVGLAERFAHITIYSHELGFLRRPYRDQLKSSDSASAASQTHLSHCLEACKRFFEYLISIPESSYLDFTVKEWASIVQAILVLSRLTFLMASNLGWNPDTTRANIPLVMYLDALCYRFQQISSTPTPSSVTETPKSPDACYVFKMILGSAKKSYERRVAAITPKSFVVEMGKAVGAARGHCPMLDPSLSIYFATDLELDDSTYGGSWELNTSMATTPATSSSIAAFPIYYDLWATMTGSWAEES